MMTSIFSDDKSELDRILGGAESDELEAMNSSPQQPDGSQELLGVVPAPTDNAVSTAGLASREGKTRELRVGGPYQGPSLSFPEASRERHLWNDINRLVCCNSIQAKHLF